jgi:hypothetical protein
MRRLLSAVLVAVAAVLPRLALACPVCMAADARRSSAYVATTVMLSLLPLAAIGGIAWLVWRRTSTRDVAVPEPIDVPALGDTPRCPRPPLPRLQPEP